MEEGLAASGHPFRFLPVTQRNGAPRRKHENGQICIFSESQINQGWTTYTRGKFGQTAEAITWL